LTDTCCASKAGLSFLAFLVDGSEAAAQSNTKLFPATRTWFSPILPILHGYLLYKYVENASRLQQPLLMLLAKPNSNQPHLPLLASTVHIVLGWLRSSLTEPLQAQVRAVTTSADPWQSLQSTFSATSRARLSELRRQLKTTTKGGSTCAEYLQKMRAISEKNSCSSDLQFLKRTF
jgi:hypothetical protein